MAERLVVLSDMWGSRKGLWITSYLGYLQQYFDIEYYDIQQLAGLDVEESSLEGISRAFDQGGMEMAIAHLKLKEKKPAHYLTFCVGGTIAWEAALKGLPIKSLYAISPLFLHRQGTKPSCPVHVVFGEYQEHRPSVNWALSTGTELEVIPNFGHTLYSDEKIIRKICMDLLNKELKKQYHKI